MRGFVVAPASLIVWAHRELTRRWLGFVVLGAAIGACTGLTVAAVDGAQRTHTAYERMRSAGRAADVVFTPINAGVLDADFTRLAALPEVAGWAGIGHTDSGLDGLPFEATPTLTSGAGWFDTVERATVLQGRMLDPAKPDEMVITAPVLDADIGLQLGSAVTWRHLSRQQSEAFALDPPPDDFDFERDAAGPVTVMHVVGVIRLPIEAVASFASRGLVLASPAWATAHLDEVSVVWTEGLVRLRHGAADVSAFEADVAKLYGRTDLPTTDLAADVKRIDSSLDVERTALLIFAAAVAVSALVVGSQSIGRSTWDRTAAVPVLSAMGLPASALLIGMMLPMVAAVAVALVAGTVADILFSARFPIGLGRQLDPDLGMHVDAGLLATGLAVMTACTLGLAALHSLAAVRAPTGRGRARRTRIVGRATRAGLPLPAAVGLSLALETGRRRERGVHAMLLAAVVGVGGVVAATMVVAGIDDARAHPSRTGVAWDVQGYGDPAHDSETLAANPAVTRSSLLSRFETTVEDIDAPLYALSESNGTLDFVTLSGRRPGTGEAAIGPRTAERLHVHIGDVIHVGPAGLSERVVGTALLLQSSFGFDEGLWISSGDMTNVLNAAGIHDFSGYEQTSLIDLAPGVSVDAATDLLPTMTLSAPREPPDLLNLIQVRNVPYALAAFLVVLALASMAHALVTAARARRRELAVLGALGLTPRQTAACVAWQAAVIGTVALAVGLPVGLLVGREVWRLIAEAVSFVDHVPFVGGVVLTAIPVVFAVLAVLAVWPAVAAARIRTAHELRTDS